MGSDAAFSAVTPGVSATLRPVKPWYQQWWTWTAVGAVVIAGVATATVLSGGGEGTGTQADGQFPLDGDYPREPRAHMLLLGF